MEGLSRRLRTAADSLGRSSDIEAVWLRGAADLLDRGQDERTAIRRSAIWLEELAPEARARKTSLLSAWVDAVEALRAAVHLHETERGPLVESLFPEWRGASLRRHADQALAAESELGRRLASSYVARRLGEQATEAALRPALAALAAAADAWAVERDRSALSGDEAHSVRAGLFALAGETARLLDRVRWVVRAALADHRELAEGVFPARGRAADAPTAAPPGGDGRAPATESIEGSAPPNGVSTAEAEPVSPATVAEVPRAASGSRRERRRGEARPRGETAAPASESEAPEGSARRQRARTSRDELTSAPAASESQAPATAARGRRRAAARPPGEPESSAAEPQASPSRGSPRTGRTAASAPASPGEHEPRTRTRRTRAERTRTGKPASPAAASGPKARASSSRGRRPAAASPPGQPVSSGAARESAPATGARKSSDRARSGAAATKHASSSAGTGSGRGQRRMTPSGRATRRS